MNYQVLVVGFVIEVIIFFIYKRQAKKIIPGKPAPPKSDPLPPEEL